MVFFMVLDALRIGNALIYKR